MPEYVLQNGAANFTVHIDVTLRVAVQPNTRTFQSANDVMFDIGYRGPSIGFGGNGIQFTARGMIYGDTSKNVGVEIGFVQSLTQSQAQATYPHGHYVRRLQPVVPVKDGTATDIWYKPDAVMQYTAEQMTTLARFGPMQGLGFRIEAQDEVKSSFPITFPRDATLQIAGFDLTRNFITCVAVRVKPPQGADQRFFLDHVTWQCSYVGNPGPGGGWIPNPGGTQFYNVGPVVPAAPPYNAPPNIQLAGPVANQAETTQLG